MRRPLFLVGFLVLIAALIVGGFLAIDRLAGEDAAETIVDKPELGTTQIVQTDLIETETFVGVLRFADPELVTSLAGGTVTAVVEVGDQLERGDLVVEIDGLPVVLFYGDRPMWRTIARLAPDGTETTGADVLQVEQNLIALGYPSLREGETLRPAVSSPDDEYDDDTARLIEDWRADLGLAEGEFIEAGRLVFLPEPVRAARILATVGSLVAPGQPLVEVSAPDQEIFLQLPVDQRELVAVGDAVQITLPDDTVAPATVQTVGSTVRYPDPDAPGLIEVSITLDDPTLGAAFDESQVDIEVVGDEVLGALAVPVNALLALAEGGYALEVDRGGVATLVAVETGVFVDGLVEVTGDIAAGDVIIVPR